MKKLPEARAMKAIALSYDEKIDSEPKVVAKGKGIIAENIIEMAKAHEIPIQEDAPLVDLLEELKLNDRIPEELYQVIAEIFAFIYKMEKSVKKP
ncbi:EscU/YscU/HrcU family type III secretion system export apparatus switch protein [Bacillus sp. REN16]|uniref:EscU/YscU/HrcU family type III secretion system export apparatus switch protein n=1 Tax=Bacillus sp. REN16 TaxID=2887296 RepID=UPI001E52E9E2|nr:EscU/YscU/HrcU family type III secretion system export apparatus switch protein [Bacillus sp. REN16]MCC3357488.1 EscU/YscU/HrcU family type III secretion system export apparatus switch protein [Bacillus sp. REN16]